MSDDRMERELQAQMLEQTIRMADGLLTMHGDALEVVGRLLAMAERGEVPSEGARRHLRAALTEATLGASNIRLTIKPMRDFLAHLNQEG